MAWKVLIAHANGEEGLAEALAGPLREAGYDVAHQGTVLVGESVVEEASKLLSLGGPVVLCGSVRAMGTKWARRLVAAARRHDGVRVFVVQMDEEADVEAVAFDETIARYWQDPQKACADLVAALRRHYPRDQGVAEVKRTQSAEERYRDLLLKSCDLVNLANLPEQDRHLAGRQLELRRLYVPLHAWVEARAGDSDPGRHWAELEGARTARSRSEDPMGEGERYEHVRVRVRVGERLSAARRLVVLGHPGAGKTTLTRWIATAYLLRLRNDPDWQVLPDVQTLPAEDLFPILVRCRQLDEESLQGTLDDILRHTLRRNELGGDDAEALAPLLLRRLDDGRALLLLDGLDEIPDPRVRARFCEHLEQIHRAHPQAPIVATSRIVGYREMGYRLGQGFEHLTLADLETEEKDDFVRRWCALTELPDRREAAASELLHDIHSSDRIERLTGNPMLLTTLALVKRLVGKLPTRRADLYGEAVEVLLNWRSEVDTPIERREAIPQLSYVAYAMCDRGVQQLGRDEILTLIMQMRAEYPHLHLVHSRTAEEFLRVIEARTGLVVEAGQVRRLGLLEPVYEFRHLTLQEYLAARALVDGYFPARDPSRKLADYVAPLAGRIVVKAADAFEKPEALVMESWREPLRLCTATCHNDDVDAVLLAILTPLADEPEVNGRARAIQAALCLADEPNASEPTARAALNRLAAYVTTGDGLGSTLTGLDAAAHELSASRWAAPLVEGLLREFMSRDYTTRSAPGGVLGMVAMARVSTSGDDFAAHLAQWIQQICQATAEQASEAALSVMSAAFTGSIAPALVEAHGLAESLLSRLRSPAPVAHAAAWALGWLARPRWRHGAAPAWSPDARQTRAVIAALTKSDADPEAVRFLAWMLGQTAERDAVDVLLPWLTHVSDDLRRDVAESLGHIGSERAVEPLIARLDDPHPSVRRAAAEALGTIGGERAAAVLSAQLDHDEAETRKDAVCGLAQKLDEIDRKLLSRYLDARYPWIDPQSPLTEDRPRNAARCLELALDDVRARYEALAARFKLRLEWQPTRS